MAKEPKRTYYIYCHTAPNGKRYIGQTCAERPERRWGKGYKGCTHMEHAIEKYGWNAFRHDIFAICHTKQMADLLEKKLIAFFRTTDDRYGYNILSGGGGRSGFAMPDETRQKISASLTGRKGRPWTPEQREKILRSMSERKKLGLTGFKKGECPEKVLAVLRSESAKRQRAVVQFDLDGNEVARYPSVASAHRATNTIANNIVVACQGKVNTANGSMWRYADEPETFPLVQTRIVY